MKIPIEWLKEYIDTKKTSKEIADDFTVIGLMLDKPITNYQNGSFNTDILDLEHRMDRSDWLSILGCARDLSSFYNINLKNPQINTQPGKIADSKDIVDIKVECPDIVNRFNTKVFKNIKVKPSPEWLKNRLESYGIPSINNIVDITNYVMVEYGQPMHAQDLSKMEKREIVIRRAKNNEKVVTLLGEEVVLTPDQFVLTQNNKATVVGGIVGGKITAVDENTTEIVLDAGNYDQNNIRKSSRYLKILNETVLRYDKFLHPDLCEEAIYRAVFLIKELAGGDFYENIDWYPKKFAHKIIKLTQSRMNLISGMEINSDTAQTILTKLGYEIKSDGNSGWQVKVPYFRTDVEVEDDLIADILRISDYNKIPVSFINSAPPKEITPKSYIFKDNLKDLMASLGAHEHISDPIVGMQNLENQIILKNALSKDKDALRTEISQSLDEIINLYKKHGENEIFVFEIGNVYTQNNTPKRYEDYKEKETLCIFYQNQNFNIYQNLNLIKQILESVMSGLGISKYTLAKNKNSKADILVENNIIGNLNTNYINLDVLLLQKYYKFLPKIITEFKNNIIENISLVIDGDKDFGPVLEEIKKFDENIENVYVVEEYHDKKLNDKKTILCEVYYKTSDTSQIRQKLFGHLKNKFDIMHRE